MLTLEQTQLTKLNRLLNEVWERNPFYTHKWCQAGVTLHQIATPEDLASFPLTTRAEFVADQSANPPLGTNLTYPLADFKRIHRSSGTTRDPVFWVDTSQSWQWVMECSQALFLTSGIKPSDRLFFAMPFGASSGPRIIYEGACRLGCCCFNAGQAESAEQLRCLKDFRPTVVVGKPSRLQVLAMSAENSGINPKSLGVQKLILTGEPCLHPRRVQIEQLWDASCFDRYGLTEAGSVASECAAHSGGMHILENEFLAEVVRPDAPEFARDGELGELVLTNLGRFGRPIVRYRTGDLVRLIRNHHCPCGRTDALLVGGVNRMEITSARATLVPQLGFSSASLRPDHPAQPRT